MTSERKRTTIRLSPKQKDLLKKDAGSVQKFIDKALKELEAQCGDWQPKKLPPKLLPAYNILREMALPIKNHVITLWGAISTLQVELDLSEKVARSAIEHLHRWRVIYRRYGLYQRQGYVRVATNEEECSILSTGHGITPSEQSADTGISEELEGE